MAGRALRESTARGWMVGFAVVATAMVWTPEASAGAVDDSTVRVFSIGTVSTEPVEYRGRRVQVASPVAGHGTGFIVGDGLVLTAQHVVEGARHVVVRLPGKSGFFAVRVVFADKDNDTAVLAFDAAGTPTPGLTLSNTPPQLRGTVYAIGYPIDPTRTQPQSARGIVAGFLENGTVQLDMALNPGNSGGPIVDDHDVVVGMATARGNVAQGVQGIGYAVPVDKLLSALDEGKRRLAETAGVPALTSRDSAEVVDELVQHGALYELHRTAEQDAGAYHADIERELASLIGRIEDPDLLVYVAAALWNAAIVVELSEPKERPAQLAPGQVRALGARLRGSAVTACARAVKLDGAVTTRSSFVQIAISSAPPGATRRSFVETPVQETSSTVRPIRIETMLGAALVIRYNADAGTTASGFGGGMAFAIRRPDQDVFATIGVAAGWVSFSKMTSSFNHSLIAAELGVTARFGSVDLSAQLAPTWYSSSVTEGDDDVSASAWVASFRTALEVRLGAVQIGAALRFLSGPTVWIEPANLAIVF